MPVISYSAFLQALGWAALNSIWQAGLLWCFFWIINRLFKLTAQKKYLLSVACSLVSFLLFLFNISYYLQYSDRLNLSITGNFSLNPSQSWLSAILSSASIAYLLLLVVPVYRFYENWLFLRELRRQGLQKTGIENRLFVQKMSKLLGIKKDVSLWTYLMTTTPVA